jgi:hypothetical protein
VIVDQREGKLARKINRDVFDASSRDDVRRAAGELSDEFTQTELGAFEFLREMYALKEGEVVRHFGEPYHLARKHLARMVQPHDIPTRRGDSMYCNFLVWRDGAIAQESKIGQSNFVENVIAVIVGHPRVESQIPEEIGDRQISGDFLYRPDATPEQKADALAKILSRELGQPIRLTFKDVERTFYFARGQVTIDPAKFRKIEDLPVIEVNGGDYDGDHGEIIGWGTFSGHVGQLAEYIGARIIDETEPSDIKCAWSRRWYDRTGTPEEQRFKLDPEVVLQNVSKQTGVEFESRQRTVRMLVLETD